MDFSRNMAQTDLHLYPSEFVENLNCVQKVDILCI